VKASRVQFINGGRKPGSSETQDKLHLDSNPCAMNLFPPGTEKWGREREGLQAAAHLAGHLTRQGDQVPRLG
jgi:hypothetical protein